MDVSAVLTDGFGRIGEVVAEVVDGLTPEQLAWRPDERANSIAWLVWHLSRSEDAQLAEVFEVPQVWTAQDWQRRFSLPLPSSSTGYGHSADQVAAVRAPADLLLGYHRAVREQTAGRLAGLAPGALDRIVDEAWDPPVSLGVRLVSVLADGLQHAGQAAYVRGLLERAGRSG